MKVFVDRDLGPAIGHALKAVGVDAVNHAEQFAHDADDLTWIPAVTAEERVILSKDRKWRSRPAERAAFVAARARAFILPGQNMNRIGLLRVLMIAWPAIVERASSMPAPFVFGIDQHGRLMQWVPEEGPDGPAERRRLQDAARARRERARQPLAGEPPKGTHEGQA